MGKIWQFQKVIGVKWLVVIARLPKCRLRIRWGLQTHHYIFCVECGSMSSCPIYTNILGLRPLSGIFCGLFKRPKKDTHMISICKKPLLASYLMKLSLKTFPIYLESPFFFLQPCHFGKMAINKPPQSVQVHS